jgi:glycosyltransferase involved in cell wall biosynthesis
MERVTSTKANFLAEAPGFDISIVTTEQMGRPVFYPLSPKIHLYHLDIGIHENFGKESYIRKCISRYLKTKEYKRKLTKLLFEIRPDITVSTLGLDIGFINEIKDGSIKIGELHFPGNFRELMAGKLSKNPIPNFVAKIRTQEMRRKCARLSRLAVLTNEEKSFWKGSDNISVIPNPLPFSSGKISNSEQKKIIAVGRLAYEKGFDLLIEAWKVVYAKHPDWELTIFGRGNQQDFLLRLIEKNDLGGVIKIHDVVANIQDVYPDYSILAFPSRYLDSFGMVILEGMSCGLPPVSFNAPCGPKDLITDKKNGYLVELGDTEELGNKINMLIESENLRKTMAKAAICNAQNYREEIIMAQWIDLFNELKNAKDNCIGR